MKRYLPLLLSSVLVLLLATFNSIHVLADDPKTLISDFALDVAAGEKDQDPQTLLSKKEVGQDEEVQAATDDGDPTTEPVVAALDEMVTPEEAQESAELVENLEATTSENDRGEILKDQAIQSSTEKPDEGVNVQDDNKAPLVDPEKIPSITPAEQLLDNLQNVEPQSQDQIVEDSGEGKNSP